MVWCLSGDDDGENDPGLDLEKSWTFSGASPHGASKQSDSSEAQRGGGLGTDEERGLCTGGMSETHSGPVLEEAPAPKGGTELSGGIWCQGRDSDTG